MGETVKDILKKFNVRSVKSLGQNFLTDENIVRRIADHAELESHDLVIEVGPGTGSLTSELAKRAGRVVAVEVDRHLIPVLEYSLREFENIEIINQDIMKTNLKDIVSRQLKKHNMKNVKVAANLPYYITTPVIMKFLEDDIGARLMIFMVQKEVAGRMVAKPGGKDYGALSVAVQYYAIPEKVMDVPPHCFIPQPDVDSTVVRLKLHETPPVPLLDKEMFFKTVKAAFGQRRKMLLNALYNSGYFKNSKEEIRDILLNAGIDPNCRGETLTIMQFAELANSFFRKNSC